MNASVEASSSFAVSESVLVRGGFDQRDLGACPHGDPAAGDAHGKRPAAAEHLARDRLELGDEVRRALLRHAEQGGRACGIEREPGGAGDSHEMLDPFERIVGPPFPRTGERLPRGRRAKPHVRRLQHVEVGPRRACRRGHSPELLDGKLAHARRQPHRRVAPRRREPGREEHERLGGRPRALILQKPFERLEEPARAAGEIGAGLAARALAGEALEGEAHARLVGGERQWHAAERQRRDHRLIRGRELGEQPVDRVPEQWAAPGVERFLIDHEDEAPAGVDAGIRAIGRWHACRCSGRSLQGSGRDAAQGAHGADAVADPDFDFSRLELRDGCAVGLDGDEIDGRARGALSSRPPAVAALQARAHGDCRRGSSRRMRAMGREAEANATSRPSVRRLRVSQPVPAGGPRASPRATGSREPATVDSTN